MWAWLELTERYETIFSGSIWIDVLVLVLSWMILSLSAANTTDSGRRRSVPSSRQRKRFSKGNSIRRCSVLLSRLLRFTRLRRSGSCASCLSCWTQKRKSLFWTRMGGLFETSKPARLKHCEFPTGEPSCRP